MPTLDPVIWIMKRIIHLCILFGPVTAGANPVLDNLTYVKYVADLSEACRSEIRIKGKRDAVCSVFEKEISTMETLTERWKSLTEEEDDEVRQYSRQKPLNLIHMRENYKRYRENTNFIQQVD